MGSLLKKLLVLFIVLSSASNIKAQRNEILNDNIASLQVVAGDDWTSMPVINLTGTNNTINISFDELSHEYHRYIYSIQHLEADWTNSDALFETDFINQLANSNVIENAEESFNTNELYTHYSLSLPNSQCQFKMSGNYCLTVFDENNDNEPIIKAYFMVVEPTMGLSITVGTNTDLDFNGKYQQLDLDVSYNGVNVTDYKKQIKTVVLQNGRWDNARVNVQPKFVKGDGLQWNHCREFIFEGGNEYRKFETLDETHTTMGLESVNWDGKEYHAYIWTDEPRPNYVYDEGANGSFYIRNSDNTDNDITTEYLWVHFRLKSPLLNDDVYLNGTWTQDSFDDRYKMQYNEEKKQYETALKLKQGYYSYQYLTLNSDNSTSYVPSEGNFFQTENQYQALVYFRANGDRTDRLVGYQQIDFK